MIDGTKETGLTGLRLVDQFGQFIIYESSSIPPKGTAPLHLHPIVRKLFTCCLQNLFFETKIFEIEIQNVYDLLPTPFSLLGLVGRSVCVLVMQATN